MSKIVHGGGWKDKREERLKVKAGTFLIVAIFGGATVPLFFDDSAWFGWLMAACASCLMISVVLFFVERPRVVETPGEPAGGDLHNLHGAGGGTVESTVKRQDESSTGQS
ncbi:MAG: hypothetical protein IPK15_27210 [Verrucomicrobia bacterium]|nr:hypothetical protein [Verrucomicrobiota bacterium]